MCIRDSLRPSFNHLAVKKYWDPSEFEYSVSYTHLRAHETKANLVCRLLLEKKSSNKVRLLAIYDSEGYSKKLVRYFKLIGFKIVKEVGSSPIDLFLRLVWGGAGTLMNGECISILKKLEKKLSLI